MGLSNSIVSYADVRAVLEVAHTHGEAKYRLASRGQAINWRLRAYKYRQLYREATTDGLGNFTPSFLDTMVLRVEDNVVHITFEKVIGTLELADGTEVPVNTRQIEEIDDDDPLLLEALKIAGIDK